MGASNLSAQNICLYISSKPLQKVIKYHPNDSGIDNAQLMTTSLFLVFFLSFLFPLFVRLYYVFIRVSDSYEVV